MGELVLAETQLYVIRTLGVLLLSPPHNNSMEGLPARFYYIVWERSVGNRFR